MSYGEPNYTPAEPYTPGPDYSQESSQQPAQSPHPQFPGQHPENDGPIEYDPLGQALISAVPGALAAGFSAGGTMLGNLLEEGGSWLGGEDVLALGEATLDQPSNVGAGGAGAGRDTGSDSDVGSDATTTDEGDGSASDPNMSVDPGTSDPDMSVDQGADDYNAE